MKPINLCHNVVMEHNAEFTRILCNWMQKWISKENLCWRIVEEYAHFTVTSNKGRVEVHPMNDVIEVRKGDVTLITNRAGITAVLRGMLQ